MITILVPTLGQRKEEIKRLLESLVLQTYSNFDVLFVNQGSNDALSKIINEFNNLKIEVINISSVGISNARNVGLERISCNNIIVLSDDDCWYPKNAIEKIKDLHEKHSEKFVFTKIYDPEKNVFYKKYNSKIIKNYSKRKLMGVSSIEISFKNISVKNFDNLFGIGSKYIVGEEVDFLLTNAQKNSIYVPTTTVYHRIKTKEDRNSNKVKAKGALYAKHFPLILTFVVIIRDLIIKKENNFFDFYSGFLEYRRKNKDD